MEPGTSADIESAGVEPVIAERRTEDGARAVLSVRREARREQRGEQEPAGLQSNIILGED
ncbi:MULTISPECIES: hypothetical protein [Streptomyces aurantiacus group]|uniref:Uncharacterized protein n=1 Tax=Streptomyces flaveus TaxID=66370 RepID=A0A917RPL8_9ACTN|nr:MULTISPECIES: hypothetical protein [Streptomyces]GGL17045.1 hypothetical protein GCM10010094_92380 [Streptomyces flaveus]